MFHLAPWAILYQWGSPRMQFHYLGWVDLKIYISLHLNTQLRRGVQSWEKETSMDSHHPIWVGLRIRLMWTLASSGNLLHYPYTHFHSLNTLGDHLHLSLLCLLTELWSLNWWSAIVEPGSWSCWFHSNFMTEVYAGCRILSPLEIWCQWNLGSCFILHLCNWQNIYDLRYSLTW